MSECRTNETIATAGRSRTIRAPITSCASSMSRAGVVLFSTAVLNKTVGSVSVYKGSSPRRRRIRRRNSIHYSLDLEPRSRSASHAIFHGRVGRAWHRFVAVDSLSTISRREEALAPAHHDRCGRHIRAVSHVHHTCVASAICTGYFPSVSRADHIHESSFYVLLRCVRQDVALSELVLLYLPLPKMRSQIAVRDQYASDAQV